MGMMDEAIKKTVKDKKDFTKTNLKEVAIRNNQVGGSHYKNFKIQPIDYIEANDLTYSEGNVIKYIVRHKAKNGKEDILKAIWYLDKILEVQYGDSIQRQLTKIVEGKKNNIKRTSRRSNGSNTKKETLGNNISI